MKHFINLSSRVINKLHIIEIIKKHNQYHIIMNNNNINGYMMFGSGGIDTNYYKVIIDKKDNDYNIITKFIEESS